LRKKWSRSFHQARKSSSLTGTRFALVEDVVSSGGAIIDALEKLRADGLAPVAALCVIADRATKNYQEAVTFRAPGRAEYAGARFSF
jgi:orotate phosphoribosyltransferase